VSCSACGEQSVWKDPWWDWRSTEKTGGDDWQTPLKRSLREKLQDAITSGALLERTKIKTQQILAPLRPYRILTAPLARRAHAVTEAFYEQILGPNDTSAAWAEKYLRRLDLPPAFSALEIGCGRGANLCHLRNAGAVVSGHDIAPQAWWSRIEGARLQVVEPRHRHLPWPDSAFDLVLIMQVAGFFDEPTYKTLAQEIDRVLKSGGLLVMQETNPTSYASEHHHAYYGRRPHDLAIGRAIFATHFEEIDHWHEGYYARRFPMVDNLWHAARHTAPGPWMIHDKRAEQLPPENRVFWVLRVRKPS
jgi:SAM-dependent methyltransferase